MPRTPNTGTVYDDGHGNNATKSHLSTNIIISVDGNVVGAVQTFKLDEARPTIKMIDEIGTDGHIDSAPNQSTDITGSCDRVRFARMRVAEAFSRGFVHVKSQRIPFDIEIHDRFADADPNNAIVTTVKNVWIKSISTSYAVNDWVISDSMVWAAEDVSSTLNNANVAQETSEGRANAITMNPFEQQTDVGQYRGALDAPGLLDAFLSDSA
jgi:hypothetical protein